MISNLDFKRLTSKSEVNPKIEATNPRNRNMMVVPVQMSMAYKTMSYYMIFVSISLTLVYATRGKLSLILSIRNVAKTTSPRLMQTLAELERLLGQKLRMLMMTSMARGTRSEVTW